MMLSTHSSSWDMTSNLSPSKKFLLTFRVSKLKIFSAVAETFECSVDEVGQEYLSAPVHFFEHFL